MSNPRPCKWCRRPEAGHRPCGQAGNFYEGVERTEPLRADRGPTVPVRVLREFLDAEVSLANAEATQGTNAFWSGYVHALRAVRERFCG